jgi:pimeloyl-ACP methyl ester carboxylesterase
MKQESQLPEFEGSAGKKYWITIDEQVSLCVFEFKPLAVTGNVPIVIVSGLVTMIGSFETILAGLSKIHPVYYVETRDKTSSRLQDKVDFDIETMGKDIAFVIKTLGLEDQRYVLFGFSMGATIITDCVRFLDSKPLCMILMEPTPEFHYPGWSLFLIRWLTLPFYKTLASFAKWYLTKFHINKNEDNEMAVISSQSIDNADPEKIRNVILAIAGYKVWERIADVKCPSLVIGTSKDGFHMDREVKQMLALLPKGSFIDLETNERTHSNEMVTVTINYIKSVIEINNQMSA